MKTKLDRIADDLHQATQLITTLKDDCLDVSFYRIALAVLRSMRTATREPGVGYVSISCSIRQHITRKSGPPAYAKKMIEELLSARESMRILLAYGDCEVKNSDIFLLDKDDLVTAYIKNRLRLEGYVVQKPKRRIFAVTRKGLNFITKNESGEV